MKKQEKKPDTFEQATKDHLRKEIDKAYQRGYLDAVNGKPMKKVAA